MVKQRLHINKFLGLSPLPWKWLDSWKSNEKWSLKLIYFFENDIYELYNLDNDIGEQNNLVSIYPERFEEMKKLLNVWSEEINAKKPMINKNFK